MKVTLSWLKDYVNIPYSTEELIDKLQSTGTEVEEVSGLISGKVVVAEIKEINPHPNADRLRLVKVFDGEKSLEVVCGAPNIEVGQKVPLAQVGAELAGELTLKPTVIRGIESQGMLCAADELGLGEDHSGIIILDNTAIPGEWAGKYLDTDPVLTLEITPNRGDTLSHLGIAREIAAFSGQKVKDKEYLIAEGDQAVPVEVEAKDLCPQYFAIKIENVTVSKSPEWLKNRLTKIGLRPINNIVDITNYILYDLGQPLHAFDSDKLDNQIIIRRASNSEEITTLDGISRQLNDEILVIADESKPIAIAGVIGGENSQVDEKTANVIIESAEFDRRSIRKTIKTIGLNTDASYRFERGIDAVGVETALKKAVEMITDLAGGQVVSKVTRVGQPRTPAKLTIEYDKIRQMTGLDIFSEQINQILTNLGIGVGDETAIVPSWRHDISIWQDLAEEVARIIGYNNVPLHELPKSDPVANNDYLVYEGIKDLIISHGFSEVINYPFLSAAEIKTLGLSTDDLLEVKNPVQSENRYLRSSLLPGILKSVAKNPIFDPVLIFEFGHIFTKEAEEQHLVLAATGKGAKAQFDAVLTDFNERFGVAPDELNTRTLSGIDIERYKVRRGKVWVAEVDLSWLLVKARESGQLINHSTKPIQVEYRPVSKYPSVTRDIAFIIDESIEPAEIEKIIYKTHSEVLFVELFDCYASEKLGFNKVNLAFHVILQRLDRTMTDKEADEIITQIITEIEHKFGAKLRV